MRLHNLDYLRGIAAFGIMIYHFTSWSYGRYDSETLLGRIGIYGVAIFYILSGLTLYYVYNKTLEFKYQSIKDYVKKRILRIFPLLWLVTILSIVITNQHPKIFDLFLNLSGLFGFISWNTYFSPGVWSIGNELVFYLFFPFFIYFSRKGNIYLGLVAIVLFLLFLYFSFIKLDNTISLNEQWIHYSNPLNQVFLFFLGFIIGHVFTKKKISNSLAYLSIIIGSLIFYIYPVSDNQINLVTGVNRLVLTLACSLIVIGIFKAQTELPKAFHYFFSFLGEISYAIYLIHPIVWTIQKKTITLNNIESIILSLIISVILSKLIYEKYEKFFIKLGKHK